MGQWGKTGEQLELPFAQEAKELRQRMLFYKARLILAEKIILSASEIGFQPALDYMNEFNLFDS